LAASRHTQITAPAKAARPPEQTTFEVSAMKLNIGKNTVEYSWDDSADRDLRADKIEMIAGYITRGFTKGRLMQDDVWCTWKDITDDELLLFTLTQDMHPGM
jgi:hypothetical protein